MNQTQPTTLLPFEPRKLARAEGPDTSKQAARAAQSLRDGHHAIILTALQGGVDLTADEIADRIGLTRHQVGRRLHELVGAGHVAITGKLRPTPTGRMAQCYCRVKA